MNTQQTKEDIVYMQKLGEKLSTMRKAKQYSVLRLKKESGVSRPTIKDMEEANRSFHFICLLQIARALNTTPSKLLKDVENAL